MLQSTALRGHASDTTLIEFAHLSVQGVMSHGLTEHNSIPHEPASDADGCARAQLLKQCSAVGGCMDRGHTVCCGSVVLKDVFEGVHVCHVCDASATPSVTLLRRSCDAPATLLRRCCDAPATLLRRPCDAAVLRIQASFTVGDREKK